MVVGGLVYKIVIWMEGNILINEEHSAFSMGMGSLLYRELRDRFPNAESIYVKDLDTKDEYWDNGEKIFHTNPRTLDKNVRSLGRV